MKSHPKKSIFLVIILAALFFTGCQDARTVSIRSKKTAAMNKALDICWDMFVLKSKDSYWPNLKIYQKNKLASGDLWEKSFKENKQKYYRDEKKRTDIFPKMIDFFSPSKEQTYYTPSYDNYASDPKTENPTYSSAIQYCDQKVAWKSAIEAENDYARKLGYPDGILGYDVEQYGLGIFSTIRVLNETGEIERSKSYLIRRGEENFRVQGMLNGYTIYNYVTNDLKSYRFALKTEKGEARLEDSALRGSYFAIIGTQVIPANAGGGIEILALKRVQ